MEKSIVVFIGVQGSGKTYLARKLEDSYPSDIISFADPVYLMARSLVSNQLTTELYSDNASFKRYKFEVSGTLMSGRQILQMIGEGARIANPRIWVESMTRSITDTFLEELNRGKDEYTVIIDDCRYPNEVLALVDFAKNTNCEIAFHHCTYNLIPGQDIPGERMANYFCNHEFSYENLIKYCMEND